MLTKILFPILLVMQSPPATQPAQPQAQPAAKPGDVTEKSDSTVDPELVRRLLGGESSALDHVEETLARLEQAEKRLTEELDCGPRTQEIQQQVLTGIDKLIEEARKNQVSARGGSQYRRRREKRPTPRPTSQEQAAGKQSVSASSAQQAGQAPSESSEAETSGGKASKSELARGWGYLPQRDRDEISQGFDEQFIGKYREQILRYYRELAERAVKKQSLPEPAGTADQPARRSETK